MSDTGNILFSHNIKVTDLDKEGKKFDKVSRLTGYSQTQEKDTASHTTAGTIEITLDYASELIAFHKNEVIRVTLARSLERDWTGEETSGAGKREMWRGGDEGLAADFDYVMFGKIYKFDESKKGDNQTTAYLSFGGLLMALRGNYRALSNLVIGENVYLCVGKQASKK
ncbi:hypothetical protein NliqN6_1292 [Naganishia liquefaciens]|uniref:DNA-directed RNA polymerases I, II, and III subunit RPABC3 n=1 Tax=Naganishia liquefaciens TaxID=104408 RepID=A0A8H3TPM8_9TREE|nr:hypothetical protein NliqN6_1292 [Naganishia liquefaciens]